MTRPRVMTLTFVWLLVPCMSALALPPAPISGASCSSTSDSQHSPGNALDWNWLSRWQAAEEGAGAWVQVDFPGPVPVGALMLVDQPDEPGAVGAIRIGFSDDTDLEYVLPASPDTVADCVSVKLVLVSDTVPVVLKAAPPLAMIEPRVGAVVSLTIV